MRRIEPWFELLTELQLDCPVFKVERSTARSPVDASEHRFFRLQAPDWAQIVPVTGNGEIVMVRQYRHGSRSVGLEIPAGQVDLGETAAQAAARECLEETGYRAGELTPLIDINPNPALFANRLYAFYTLDVQQVDEIQNTATEQTEVVLVPRAEIPELLRSGAIDHALVALTLWRFLDAEDGHGGK